MATFDATYFGDANKWFWIGYSDQAAEGTWTWADGDSANYASWATSICAACVAHARAASNCILQPSPMAARARTAR